MTTDIALSPRERADPLLHDALAQRLADWCREMAIENVMVDEQMLRLFYADSFFHEDLLDYLVEMAKRQKGTGS